MPKCCVSLSQGWVRHASSFQGKPTHLALNSTSCPQRDPKEPCTQGQAGVSRASPKRSPTCVTCKTDSANSSKPPRAAEPARCGALLCVGKAACSSQALAHPAAPREVGWKEKGVGPGSDTDYELSASRSPASPPTKHFHSGLSRNKQQHRGHHTSDRGQGRSRNPPDLAELLLCHFAAVGPWAMCPGVSQVPWER